MARNFGGPLPTSSGLIRLNLEQESNAEFVEMYLLNQVRTVKEGMEIGCWVGTTLIRFVVGESVLRIPRASECCLTRRRFPDSTSPVSDSPLMLSSATELIVAPKSRHPPKAEKTSTHDLSGPPVRPAVTSAATAEWEQAKKRLLRLLPAEMEPVEATAADPMKDQTVYVSRGLYELVHRAFPGETRMTISHQPRPMHKTSNANPTSTQADNAGTAGGDEEHATPAPESTAPPSRPIAEVRILESAEIPVAHAWVPETVRRELGLKQSGAFELLK